MKKTDLAYMAGIMDGEGCIHIHKQKPGPSRINPTYYLSVELVMIDKWICELFRFSFGGSNVNQRKRKEGYNTLYTWAIIGVQATTMLKCLLPYLKLKRAQAELGIKFVTEKQLRNRRIDGKYYLTKPPHVAVLEEAEFILMKQLKGHPASSAQG